MNDTQDHPPIPDRVAAGARWMSSYTLGKWYHPGAFGLADSPDGTPPGISEITHALLITCVPDDARPDDPRNLRRWLGKALSQSPHLGTVPYPDEDPAVAGPELDALWSQAQVQRRRDHAGVRELFEAFVPCLPHIAHALGAQVPRPGVLLPPEQTWDRRKHPQAQCVSCGTGQWAGTSRCHRCRADQPGVAWETQTEVAAEWFRAA